MTDKSISTGSDCEEEKRLLAQALDKETATTGVYEGWEGGCPLMAHTGQI